MILPSTRGIPGRSHDGLAVGTLDANDPQDHRQADLLTADSPVDESDVFLELQRRQVLGGEPRQLVGLIGETVGGAGWNLNGLPGSDHTALAIED